MGQQNGFGGNLHTETAFNCENDQGIFHSNPLKPAATGFVLAGLANKVIGRL